MKNKKQRSATHRPPPLKPGRVFSSKGYRGTPESVLPLGSNGVGKFISNTLTGPGCGLDSGSGHAGAPKTRFRSDALKMDEISADCIFETTKPYLTTLLVKVSSDDKDDRIYWQA